MRIALFVLQTITTIILHEGLEKIEKYAFGDCDIYCLVTGENLLGEGGCRRTNKFILSQNRQQLIDKLYEEEAKKWSEYTKQFEKPQ